MLFIIEKCGYDNDILATSRVCTPMYEVFRSRFRFNLKAATPNNKQIIALSFLNIRDTENDHFSYTRPYVCT